MTYSLVNPTLNTKPPQLTTTRFSVTQSTTKSTVRDALSGATSSTLVFTNRSDAQLFVGYGATAAAATVDATTNFQVIPAQTVCSFPGTNQAIVVIWASAGSGTLTVAEYSFT